MENAGYFLSLFIEAGLAVLLFYFTAPPKKRPRKIFLVFYWILYGSLLTVSHLAGGSMQVEGFDGFALYLLVHVVMCMILGFWLYRKNISHMISMSLFFVSCIVLSTFASNLMSRLFPAVNVLSSRIYGKILLALIVPYLIRFQIDPEDFYPASFAIVMIIMPILNILTVLYQKMLRDFDAAVTLSQDLTGLTSLVIELICYYMLYQSVSQYHKSVTLTLINQYLEAEHNHVTNIKGLVNEYHQIRHDIKNHVAVMDKLLSQHKYDMLHEYFYSFNQEVYQVDSQVETGNELVNELVELEYAKASQKKIPMYIEGALPKTIPLPEYHISSLIVNLLDNAIEASEKLEDPKIKVKVGIVKNYFSFTVTNRIDANQAENARTHKTTKQNSELHGLGTQIIDRIVKEHNGIAVYDVRKHHYAASVMLEMDHALQK